MKIRRPFTLAAAAAVVCTLNAWQSATTPPRISPAYVPIYESGRWFPHMAELGPGIVYDRQANRITVETPIAPPPPALQITDEVYTSTQIIAPVQDAGGTASASLATAHPADLTPLFVASQATLYPRITWERYQTGMAGFALSPERRIHVRPYTATQGTIRVISLTLTTPTN